MNSRLKRSLVILAALFLAASAAFWLLPQPDRAPAYKRGLYEAQKPSVVLIGSARAQALRGEDFEVSFLNMAGQSSLDRTVETTDSLIAIHKPATLILAVDFWWFNDKAATGRAALKGDVDSYGSMRYESILNGQAQNPDAGFADSFRKVRKGESVFAHGDAVSQARWDKFAAAVSGWRAQGLEVIVFLPPLAPSVIDEMLATNGYAYVSDLRKRLRGVEADFYDFHDPRFMGGSDCEFVTGLSGGDIVLGRALLYMAARGMHGFGSGVDLPAVAEAITRRAGFVSRDVENETDALSLGCVRGARAE